MLNSSEKLYRKNALLEGQSEIKLKKGFEEILNEYEYLLEEKKVKNERLAYLKEEILAVMAENSFAFTPTYLVEYLRGESSAFDSARFKKEHSGLYERYQKLGSRLNLKVVQRIKKFKGEI
jgi:predicted phage-related endonuclease